MLLSLGNHKQGRAILQFEDLLPHMWCISGQDITLWRVTVYRTSQLTIILLADIWVTEFLSSDSEPPVCA